MARLWIILGWIVEIKIFSTMERCFFFVCDLLRDLVSGGVPICSQNHLKNRVSWSRSPHTSRKHLHDLFCESTYSQAEGVDDGGNLIHGCCASVSFFFFRYLFNPTHQNTTEHTNHKKDTCCDAVPDRNLGVFSNRPVTCRASRTHHLS